MLLQEICITFKETNTLKVKIWTDIYYININQKKARMLTLILKYISKQRLFGEMKKIIS